MEDDYVLLQVRDTGKGIPEDRQAYIFDSFQQADDTINDRYGGVGLGLAICKQLTEAMGGNISVQSAPGQGAVFSCVLYLPTSDKPPECLTHDSQKAIERKLDLSSRRVLVVDDVEISQRVIREFLRTTSCDLVFAENGRDALQHWQSGDIDLVLMDMRMPEMDGFQTVQAIRWQERKSGSLPTPIIAVTAGADQEDAERALAVGCDIYLVKPLSRESLLGALAQLLEWRDENGFAIPGVQ
jgi:CheY-like chemotaxis protein